MNSTANGNASSKGLGKKILKVAATFGIGITVFFACGLLWIFYKLPSPSELKTTFFREIQSSESSNHLTESDIAVPAPTHEPVQVGETELAQGSPQNQKETPSQRQAKEVVLEDLMDQKNGISKACEALSKGTPSVFSKPNALKEFNNEKLARAIQNGERDPGIEAILPSIRYMFSFSSMQDLIATVKASEGQEDFAQKAEFYTKVYDAFNDLEVNKENLETVLDRSYLLFMMSKVAEKNPLAIQSSESQSYCLEIEEALNQGLTYRPEIEGQEFLKFLESANVKPTEIGFNPDQKTNLKFEFSSTGIQVKNTWLTELFDSLEPTKRN